jgi:aspartyl-tRNA(Asn)/glutamyl-tRNA(Gln) amidotransferase subunit A
LKRILRGRDVTADEYTSALNNTLKLRLDVQRLFESVDAIITPTVPIPPPTIAELQSDPDTLRAREILMLRNTRPFNVLGLPTVTVPCGVTRTGLPVGLQITTAAGQDAICLGLAYELSCQIAPW